MTPFSESTIKVSPDKISQIAQEAKVICEKLLMRMESIEQSVSDSQRFWDSESFALLNSYFREDKNEYGDIKRSLRRKIEELEKIAALYDTSEKTAAESASALPDSVFL